MRKILLMENIECTCTRKDMFFIAQIIKSKIIAIGYVKSTTIGMVQNVLQKPPLKEIKFLLGGDITTMMLFNMLYPFKHNALFDND